MKNNIAIRRLTKNDLDVYFVLRLESLQNAPTNFLSSYEDEKGNGFSHYSDVLSYEGVDNLILGAFHDNALVGIVGVFLGNQEKTKHKSVIWGLYVQPPFRKQGIGKALLQDAINHATQTLNSSVINISVETTNIDAKKLYESFGFKTWGKEPKAIRYQEKYYDEEHLSLLI